MAKDAIRTTIDSDLKKDMQKLAIDVECGMNDLIEVSFKYCKKFNDVEGFKNLVKENGE